MWASGKSSLTPPAPWTWMARSMIRRAMFGAATLMARDLDARRALLPTVSISQAVFSVSSRACSMLDPRLGDPVLDDALLGERLAEGRSRDSARSHISSSARSATPIAAHAVVDAARAEPGLGDGEAAALLAEQVGGRAPGTFSKIDLAVALLVHVAEHRQVAHDRHARACPSGTRIIDCWRCGGAVGSVLPITMKILQRGCSRAGDPPLAAVDDVVVAVALDAQLDVGGVAATRRPARSSRTPSGSRPRAAAAATLLLLGRAEHGEHLHVAGVGRRAVAGLARRSGGDP